MDKSECCHMLIFDRFHIIIILLNSDRPIPSSGWRLISFRTTPRAPARVPKFGGCGGVG